MTDLKVGTIKRADEIGYAGLGKYTLHACIDCGKLRWVYLRQGEPKTLRCVGCASLRRFHPTGKLAPNFKDGRTRTPEGYVKVLLPKSSFFYPMARSNGYVMEHRLVMAKHIGRCLHRWEIVHHINHTKDDNSIENLQLVSDDRHKQITILENRIKLLENKVSLLEAENIRLELEFEEAHRRLSESV